MRYFAKIFLSLSLWAMVSASTEANSKQKDPTQATQVDIKIIRKTLGNGLKVVLNPDHSVPTVAIAVYYDVGSRNEQKGRSGFAHLFEHMMFQGSANVGKGEHFQLVMNRGGSMNGTTSNDRTNYFETLPSNELALGLWLEADRMKSLAVTKENFENQRQTVMEERRQSVDNRPYVPSMLRINELAYGDYFPYAHSTIGDMEDLKAAPLKAVQEFFDTYYAPNNAVIAISGDFQQQQAISLIEEYFGNIPKSKVPKFDESAGPVQNEPRYEKITDDKAQLPAFHIAYHIPKSRQPDHYPLELLAMVLGDGNSSRMYQKLVKDKQLVQEVDVNTDDRRGPDLFSFWAVMAAGHQPQEAQKVILDEIKLIQKQGITEQELQKSKNQLRSSYVFLLQSNLSRAMQLATYEMYWGNANLITTELQNYERVTLDDIKRVANTYLVDRGRTILDVVPESK